MRDSFQENVEKSMDGRFSEDEDDGVEESARNDQRDRNDTNAETDTSSMNERNAWNVGSVKSEWNANTVYLPPFVDDHFDDEYRRLQYELDREIKKDRHYKPLIFMLGLERLAGMERTEIMEFLERMEAGEVDVDTSGGV